MNLSQLIFEARSQLNDVGVASVEITDERITSYINESINEACLRARLIIDSTTTVVTDIAVVSGQSVYPIHSSIVLIERVFVEAAETVLQKASFHDMDMALMSWQSDKGSLTRYILDMDAPDIGSATSLRVYPIPIENHTLKITAYRLPLVDLVIGSDIPEIQLVYHNYLVDWVIYRVLSEPLKSDKENNQSMFYMSRFESNFGLRPDARQLEWRRKQRPKRVIGKYL